jgi:hypothetical protein
MYKYIGIILILFFLSGCGASKQNILTNTIKIKQTNMKLFSRDFVDNQIMDAKFTCDGGHTRPHLTWSDIPVTTKFLALAMFDPDAPGDGFLHWLVVNLPPQNTELNSEDVLPTGAVQIKNDAGKFEYHGPCPPSGVHRYQFTLYALDTADIIPKDYNDFLNIINGHVIDSVMLTGLYERK